MPSAPGFVLWFVGLPGSGKSTIARAALDLLRAAGADPLPLVMDERRKSYFPHPTYSPAERAEAYRLFASEAIHLARQGRNILMDGTAHELSARQLVRLAIPRFAEIHIRCPLNEAMRRESARPQGAVMADLYRKALARKSGQGDFPGLGQVIGVDVPFEENPQAEVVIDSLSLTPPEAGKVVADYVRGKGWVSG